MSLSTEARWLILLALLAQAAPAQWLDYRTPGIPRLADGKPNLEAPAPKTPERKPDLSGIWQSALVEGGANYILNIAHDLPEDSVQPWARALYKQRTQDLQKDQPWGRCLPGGVLPTEISAVPYRIVQAPGLVVILYEEHNPVPRLIFTDGRQLPKDPNPSWMGYSVGHWEEDALVVETAGFNDRTWLDANGHPHSEALRLTERFRRLDFGHLELRITIDDPQSFTQPFTVIKHPKLKPDYEMLEFVCAENERDSRHLVGK